MSRAGRASTVTRALIALSVTDPKRDGEEAEKMIGRQGITLILVLGLSLIVIPQGCWAIRNEVAQVLARTGAVIQCGSNPILLGNEIRTVPHGLLVIDAKIAEYVKQVVGGTTGGTRGLQALSSMNIAIIKYRKVSPPSSWLLCNLDNIDDPVVMEDFLLTSKRDSDGRCSVKNFDNEKVDDGRFIGYLTDTNHNPKGKVTVQARDEEGVITLAPSAPDRQLNDAKEIIIIVGHHGTTVHPQSRCQSGTVPVAVPGIAETPGEGQRAH